MTNNLKVVHSGTKEFKIASNKRDLLCHRDMGVEAILEWKLSWRTTLFDSEIQMADNFLGELSQQQIQPNREDRCSWKHDQTGYYSTKSRYDLIWEAQMGANQNLDFVDIWKLKIPSKSLVFAWRPIRDRLPTRMNLRRRQCPFCGDVEEEPTHLEIWRQTLEHILISEDSQSMYQLACCKWFCYKTTTKCTFISTNVILVPLGICGQDSWRKALPSPTTIGLVIYQQHFLIRVAVQGWGGYVLNHKIKLLKQCIKQWSLTNGEANARKVTMIKKELNALENVLNDRPLSQVEVTLKKSLQVQLWEAAYAYESMLRQKARIKWLKVGDDNSTYFHRLISHRRRKNAIPGIFMDGVWIHEPCRVKNAAVFYFKDRFLEDCSNRPILDGVYFSSLDLRDKESLNRLPTRDNLRKTQVTLPSYSCPLCDHEEESIYHLMFNCEKTRSLWWETMRWVNRVGSYSIDPKNHFLQFTQWNSKDSTNKRWEFLWLALSFSIWYHRNAKIFKNQPFTPEKVMDDALFHTWSWIKCVEKDFQMHFNFWSTNLKDVLS
ncbi:hypothetical protein HKD37_16G045288 [Glycine soja]